MTALKILFCALWYFSSTQGQEHNGEIHVSYTNEIGNGYYATEEVPLTDCQKERTKWDKLFTMLENSQMKENMLLQSIDEIIRVELQSVRAEMLQFVSSFATTCANTIEKSMSQITSQMEKTVSTYGEQNKWSEKVQKTKQGKVLDEILLLNYNMSSRLDGVEAACQSRPEGDQQIGLLKDIQSHLSTENYFQSLLLQLERSRTELHEANSLMVQRLLPGGCEMAIFFPSRSPRIYASVHPATESALHEFTACVWVKVTDVLDKTIVFSYGTKRSPYEIQFYLSHQSAVFIVRTDENKLVAENVTSPGQWAHFCGTWSSEDGTAALWVNGELKAQAADVNQGYVIPDKGILQLGQEKNGCCVGGGFDESLSFSGKMTGFNLWDHALNEDEIVTLTGAEDACNIRGNVVGWGVTQIQLHGGSQFIF